MAMSKGPLPLNYKICENNLYPKFTNNDLAQERRGQQKQVARPWGGGGKRNGSRVRSMKSFSG